VQDLFPDDPFLTQLQVESYMGVPLWKSNGHHLGLIALMDEKPLQNPKLAEALLQIAGIRVSHELERRQDEHALKTSSARYQAVVEDQTEFIVRWKPDGTRTFVNKAYSRYFEQPAEALIGTSFFPLIAPEDQEKVRRKIARISVDSPIQIETHRVITPGGGIKWHEWSDRGIFDQRGNLIELQSVGRDITERKEAENALEHYSNFQSLITTFATEFINIPHQKIESAILDALQAIGEFVGASRCTINMFDKNMTSFSRTHEWCAAGMEASLSEFQDIVFADCGIAWAQVYFGNKEFIIPNLSQLPDEAVKLTRDMARQKAQALLVVEMRLRDKTLGFITVEFSRPNPPYAEDIMKLLHVVSETFINALDRKQSNEEIRLLTEAEELQRHHRNVIEALLETGMVLSQSLDLDELMNHIFETMQRVVGYDTAAILMKNDEEVLDVLATYGYPADDGLPLQLELRHLRYVAEVIRTQEPAIFSDTRFDPHFTIHPAHKSYNVSYLFAPMLIDKLVIGVIALGSRTPYIFQEEDSQYLQIFAQQTSLALRNAQLYKRARSLAALEERQRLARDLHDSVSQTLSAAATMAELVPRVLEKDANEANKYLKDVQELTRTAMAEMRTLLVELRRDALIRTDLGILLKQLCDALTGNVSARISLEVTEKLILPEADQIVFYRIAQEALNNILKHAHATEVRVKLGKDNGYIILSIWDNGRGFEQSQVPANHFGLKIMQERATSIGASLIINSTSGTEIILSKMMP
jgi:PAS domain S-box-containing protein